MTTIEYSGVWRKCEVTTNPNATYALDAANPRIAIKNAGKCITSAIGTTPLPKDAIVRWDFNILKTTYNNGGGLYLGVAYEEIAKDDIGISDAGFFFYPFSAQLWSGAPHDYMNKEYGPRKKPGSYIRDGESIQAVMDTAKGELSFVVNGESFGVAYEKIPTGKALYPCARMEDAGSTVGLNLSAEEVRKYQNPGEKFSTTWKPMGPGAAMNAFKVSASNPRVVYKGNDAADCTLITKDALPAGKVVSWDIRFVKSVFRDAMGVYIGVAPRDILTGFCGNYNTTGWYLDCYRSLLNSGAPHKYRGKEYGPRKEKAGEYLHPGESVGVVMDTAKGNLSFVLGGVDLGIAYEGIPLDTPLVPCVILTRKFDEVEIC